MLVAIIIILALIANVALWILYHRRNDDKLLELSAITNRNLNNYCDSLESEMRCLIAENRRQGLRIEELESRLQRTRARQSLGLRAYEVGASGLVLRQVRSVN